MTTPTARAAGGPAAGSGKITREAVLAARCRSSTATAPTLLMRGLDGGSAWTHLIPGLNRILLVAAVIAL
jgi:hypothetical protein